MSDASKLAKIVFSAKPHGAPLASYVIQNEDARRIKEEVQVAILDALFSSSVSYIEALNGLKKGASSWPIVKLYYSCFYSIKSLLLTHNLVPFISGEQYLCDLQERRFMKAGSSSHKWNWGQLRKINRLKNNWFLSQDSEESYKLLQDHREKVNYKYSFVEPAVDTFLKNDIIEIQKRLKMYREDDEFFYTYLDEHVALAYPTKLLYQLDKIIRDEGLSIDFDKKKYLNEIWTFKERCPGS